MNTPMHRFKYTKLTKEQIASKLARTEAGPECVSGFSDILAGKSLKIVTDDGPILSYSFKNKNRLTFSENGGSSVDTGYGSLTLKQMVFFSHMLPKTLKGYNVFIDLDSNLVTAFEVWFGGGKDAQGQVLDDREVQRQFHFGYVEVAGKEAPKARFHTTNRIEGKGMYWKQDTGIETLEFYPSVVSSNFVELTRHPDDLSYCSPSDYILVDDNLFIYDRTECELSGIMTMYAVDLLTETQAGMRLGFNEKDELEYYMFRGTGKVVGHLTRLQPFNEHGEKISLGMGAKTQPDKATPVPKGQRTAYRPARTFPNMSEERSAMTTTARSGNIRSSIKRLSIGGIRANHSGTRKPTERLKPMKSWFFFAHMHSGSRPRASVKIALDLLNGLTTCIFSKMGTEYYGNEVSYRALFGVAEMDGVEAPQYMRHEYTDELVGRGFTRSWSDITTSMHLYTTPHSAAWTIYTEDQTLGLQWCAPCIYVKLRDGVFIFNLMEEACDGIETCIVINEKTMRVCGFEYEGGSRGLDLTVVGAIARPVGSYDIKHFFGPTAKRYGA